MKKRRSFYALVLLAIVGVCSNASATWSPAWQVNIADELDTGSVVYKDTYALGAGGNGVDAFSLIDDVLKVHVIGWPDSGYSGPLVKAISIASTVDAVELGKDARADAAEITWNIDLNASASMSGTETLSWTLVSVPGGKALTLKDFGSDSARTSLVASTNMKSASSYVFSSTKSAAATRYIQVVLGGGAPPVPVDLSVSLVGGDPVLSWDGSSSENYSIYCTDDLASGWSFAAAVSGVDGVNQWADDGTIISPAAGTVGKRFYKVDTTN